MRPRWLATALPLFLPTILASYACGLDDSVINAQPNSGSDGGGVDGTISGGDATTGGDASTADGNSLDSGSDGPITNPPTLVYANTQSELYSFNVDSNVLTDLGALTGCGDNMNDLAVDSTGQLYINEQNDAIYRLAVNGACSGKDVLNSIAGDVVKISARNAGAPVLVAVDTSHEDFYSLDPASTPQATVTVIANNLFSAGSPKGDLACASSGTCWTTLDHSHCSAGSSSSCLYSFAADGGGAATSLGAIGVHPEGLAYAKGALYSFADDGSIAKIALSGAGAPLATVVAVTPASGTTQPEQWNGAGSSSANK